MRRYPVGHDNLSNHEEGKFLRSSRSYMLLGQAPINCRTLSLLARASAFVCYFEDGMKDQAVRSSSLCNSCMRTCALKFLLISVLFFSFIIMNFVIIKLLMIPSLV